MAQIPGAAQHDGQPRDALPVRDTGSRIGWTRLTRRLSAPCFAILPILLLVLWQLTVELRWVAEGIIPPPQQVLRSWHTWIFGSTTMTLSPYSGTWLDNVTYSTRRVLQGFGLGFVFAPLSTITFSTLPPHYRTEAAALTALMRSLGGSAGIAVLVALLSQGTQVRRAELSESISLLNPLWHEVLRGHGASASTELAIWDQELTRQAAMIAYLDDFRLMMYAVIASMPSRRTCRSASASPSCDTCS